MNARDLQRYKGLLLAKLDELSAARDKATTLVPRAGGSEGDLMDYASAGAEAELQVQLHQSDVHLRRAIDDALARLRAGTFGVCEACKRSISKARLKAVPWTRLCRKCKERASSQPRDGGERAQRVEGKGSNSVFPPSSLR